MNAHELLDEIIEAHGGRGRWQAVNVIEATLSSGGLAFAARGQPFALRNLKISVHPHTRRVVLRDFCRQGWCGVWAPSHVQIRDENDKLVRERWHPRRQFDRPAKWVHWDQLDILYFAGYALWNYLSFPFILEVPGVTVAASDCRQPDACRLLATFDACIATHSAVQTFHVDASRHLVRHDYTADLMGRWATVANSCLASERVSGLRFYTRRKVYPRFGANWVLPWPTLVWIEIDDIRVNSSPAAGAPDGRLAQRKGMSP